MRSRGALGCSEKAHLRTTIDAVLDISAPKGVTSLMMHRLGDPQMRAAVEPTGGNRPSVTLAPAGSGAQRRSTDSGVLKLAAMVPNRKASFPAVAVRMGSEPANRKRTDESCAPAGCEMFHVKHGAVVRSQSGLERTPRRDEHRRCDRVEGTRALSSKLQAREMPP